MKTNYLPADQDFLTKLGFRIRKLREKTGLSQERFALKHEIDRTYYSAIERGERNLSILNLKKIANGLKVEPYKLLMFK